ncbi:MAG TPA: hypothetical protein VJ866_21830 [Pyrinomonadaceae bacterium]|nr:hypothetical protein [Pyrinomonadaceae bacterium]
MFEEKLDEKFFEMRVNLARHELEVMVKQFRDACIPVGKLIAQKVEAGEETMDKLREYDKFMHEVLANHPRKMAEWDAFMSGFEFSEDVIEGEE